MSFNKVKSELLKYKTLSHDWDSCGAFPPLTTVIESSVNMLLLIQSLNLSLPIPSVNSLGHVSLYWETENLFIQILFEEPYSFTYVININGTVSGKDDYNFSSRLPNDLLNSLKSIS